MKTNTRTRFIAIAGAFALSTLVACGAGQPAPEPQASSEAGGVASSSSDTKPATPSKADCDIVGDGWGFVYPSYWKSKVKNEPIDNPIPKDETAKGWSIKTDGADAYLVMNVADVSKDLGAKYLMGGEDDATETTASTTLGSGQAATIRKAKDGSIALVAELPNGRWLALSGTDKIPSSPSESQKKELSARCDLQSFGKKSSWEDYDESLVTNFLEQIAGSVYVIS